MRELRPDAEEARDCWAVGVQPLVDAFGPDIVQLLNAIVYSHRENFPVPVFITGSARARAGELLQAVNELTGDWPIIARKTTSLPTLRLAAEQRQPLLIADAAPGTAPAGASMFEQISAEMLDYGSPLQQVGILVATGGRRVDRRLRARSLHIHLPSPGPSGPALRKLTGVSAASARRLVQIYLQQNADRALTPKARRQVHIAADLTVDPGARRDAALAVAGVLASAMQLPALEVVEDSVLVATRMALLASVREPAVAGRLGRGMLYAVPAELLPRIQASAGDSTITQRDVARSLERAGVLATGTMNRSEQGSTTPTRVKTGLKRVWRVRSAFIR